jgi:NAD(P)H-dependent flavin oxidoreductase YrpB (nitropropane dioxygenase family)
MAGAAGGLLAARVHRGGGFGFIAGGHQPVEDLVKEIAIARRELKLKDDDPLPLSSIRCPLP